MIPNPIHKVLSTFRNCGVRALLMGGQACVFYGAAEFSRDTDFALLADEENLARLRSAASELDAAVIAVPPLTLDFLARGHAVHFRCRHPEAAGLRVDVMARMRGVAEFPDLWERRTTLEGADGTVYELMSLPDLVLAKKTQRDKDWPMIRRLVEADHLAASQPPTPRRASFWLRESRTTPLLLDLAHRFPEVAQVLARDSRPLLGTALEGDAAGVEEGLAREERLERAADRAYWAPLKEELERLRHGR